MTAEPPFWSVFNRDERLVLIVNAQPGILTFARVPDGDVAPVQCPFATLQCLDPLIEHDVLKLIRDCRNVEGLIEALARRGFRIAKGRPVVKEFARL